MIVHKQTQIRVDRSFNRLFSSVPFSILLWLTPNDFTRQWEIDLLANKGLNQYK